MQYIALTALFLAVSTLTAGEYSTYIGDDNSWRISRLMVDASGNTYVAGSRTFDLSFDPLRPNLVSEATVTKLDANGKTVLFAAAGGKANDGANAVAVDSSGNIFIAGSTSSPNFPVRNALYPNPIAVPMGSMGFLTKFSPDGSQILFSTYFPAAIDDLTVDAAGAVYVTGTAFLTSFPVTPGLPGGRIGGIAPLIYGAFLTKIAPAGDRIVYSTVLSGQQKNCGAGSTCFTSSRGARSIGVALDAAGNAYIAGSADVTDLPTTPGALTPTGAGAFVAKVNAAGTALAYLTYIGTGGITFNPFFTPATTASALAVDAAGNAYLAGTTFDPHLPVTTGGYQTEFHGWKEIDSRAPQAPPDAFALKLNPSGTAVVWGSYLGGNSVDTARAAALDPAGNFWVAGSTRSTEFPNRDGWSTDDDFIVAFDATGGLSYSARYPAGTVTALAVDAAGLLRTATPDGVVSAIAPSPRPAMRPWTIGPVNGHIAPGEVISIYGPHLAGPVSINGVAAPVLYSSDQQINAVVPFEIAGQTRAKIRVGSGLDYDSAVLAAVPQIFAPALNEDGTLNGPNKPARAGSAMSIWVTGAAAPFPAAGDGTVATDAQAYFVGQLFANGVAVKILYGGAAPGLVAGIAQINFVAPESGPLVLTVGRYVSPPLLIYVTR